MLLQRACLTVTQPIGAEAVCKCEWALADTVCFMLLAVSMQVNKPAVPVATCQRSSC
jgi:hypothetical protein